MQPFNMIMIYYWDKKIKKYCISWKLILLQLKNIDLMPLAQRIHFLQDVFQMTAIALVSLINQYH